MVFYYNFKSAIPPKSDKYFFVDIPTTCPNCGVSFSAIGCDINHYSIPQKEHRIKLYSNYYCPSCFKAFVVQYDSSGDENDINHPIKISQRLPYPKANTLFSDNVKEFSRRYCEVYSQAAQAESYGLNEICGMAYRKAFEILIKDYAIKLNPDKEEQICKAKLFECIKNYISDERVKELAAGANWLGNNETHYKQIDSSYDIEDMKRFIKSIETLIDCDLTFDKAKALRENL